MMEYVSLSQENKTAYESILPPDIYENIGRMGFFGVADTKAQHILIWRERNVSKVSRILFLKAASAEAADALLSEYESEISEHGMAKSTLELPIDLGEIEKEALNEKGYDLKEAESSFLCATLNEISKLPIAKKCDISQDVLPVGGLNIRQFQQGMRLGMRKGAFVEDAGTLPLIWFECSLSACVCIEGRVCGYLLLHKLSSGALMPEAFYITEPAVRGNLMDMIHFSLFHALDELDGDTRVLIPRHRDMARALTDKLLPGLGGEQVLAAEKFV